MPGNWGRAWPAEEGRDSHSTGTGSHSLWVALVVEGGLTSPWCSSCRIALSSFSLIVQDSSPGFIIWGLAPQKREMAAAAGPGLEVRNVTVAAISVQGLRGA